MRWNQNGKVDRAAGTNCPTTEALQAWMAALANSNLDTPADVTLVSDIALHLRSCATCQSLVDEMTQARQLRERYVASLAYSADEQNSLKAAQSRLDWAKQASSINVDLSSVVHPRETNITDADPLDTAKELEDRKTNHDAEFSIPETIGKYRILRLLGKGGMGTVLLAHDSELNRLVAIKTIGVYGNRAFQQRLVREGQAIARLDSPYCVRLFSVDRDDQGQPFLVMEYVEGESLAHRLQSETRLDPELAARICVAIAKGVQVAHEQGILHRDIKPANIFLTAPQFAKLGDFGLALINDHEESFTRSGVAVGTPAYLSPEVAGGAKSSVQSDIYGLGCVLYESLSGIPPYQGTYNQVLRQIQQRNPTPLRTLNELVPRDLEIICHRALAREPQHRYPSAADFQADLTRWLQGANILAKPASKFQLVIEWTRRNPRVATLLGAVICLVSTLVVGAVIATTRISHEIRNTQDANRIAEDKASQADRLRNIAVEQLNELVFQIQSELKDRPGTVGIRKKLLERSLQSLTRIADEKQDDQLNRVYVMANLRLAEVYSALDNTGEANQRLSMARSMAERLHQENPEDSTACGDLGTVCLALGEAALGAANQAEAEEMFQRAHFVFQLAMDGSPNNPKNHTEMALAAIRLGDLARRKANEKEADRQFQIARESAETAVQIENSNAKYQRTLATALNRLCSLSLSRGDLDASIEYATQWQNISANLLATDPESTTYRRDLALGLAQLAKIEILRQDFSKAVHYSVDSTNGYRAIVDANPQHAVAQSHLAVALYAEGTSWFAAGDLTQAHRVFSECMETHRRLFENDLDATQHARLAADALQMLAMLELRRADLKEAIIALNNAINLLERVRKQDLQSPEMQSSMKAYRKSLIEFQETSPLLESIQLAGSISESSWSAIESAKPAVRHLLAYLLAGNQEFESILRIVTLPDNSSIDSTDPLEEVSRHFSLAATYAKILRFKAAQQVAGELANDQAKQIRDLALNALSATVKLSPVHRDFIRTDPDFIPLRTLERYSSILRPNQ